MRDQRCADTVHRLLNDLEGLLSSSRTQNKRTTTDRPVAAVPIRADVTGSGSVRGDTVPSVEVDGQRGPAWGGTEETTAAAEKLGEGAARVRRSSLSNSGNTSLTQQLRSKLISLREAMFRHASFLEFLPAPERVDRLMIVPGAGMDGEVIINKQGDQDADVDELDPEVQ